MATEDTIKSIQTPVLTLARENTLVYRSELLSSRRALLAII
jgi:hypothetical protein